MALWHFQTFLSLIFRQTNSRTYCRDWVGAFEFAEQALVVWSSISKFLPGRWGILRSKAEWGTTSRSLLSKLIASKQLMQNFPITNKVERENLPAWMQISRFPHGIMLGLLFNHTSYLSDSIQFLVTQKQLQESWFRLEKFYRRQACLFCLTWFSWTESSPTWFISSGKREKLRYHAGICVPSLPPAGFWKLQGKSGIKTTAKWGVFTSLPPVLCPWSKWAPILWLL